MLIHLVRDQNAQPINSNTQNLWDKIYFQDDNDPTIQNNTLIKCNRNLSIYSKHLHNFLFRLVKKGMQNKTVRQYPNGPINHKESYEYHGHIPSNFLHQIFQQRIQAAAPQGYHFVELGVSINSYNTYMQFKHLGRKRGNLEIKFCNPNKPNEQVILNIHIKYNQFGLNDQGAINKVNNLLVDFNSDQTNLNLFTNTINLNNYDEHDLEIASNSIGPSQTYWEESMKKHLVSLNI